MTGATAYEDGEYWLHYVEPGLYYVMHNGPTSSSRVATVCYKSDDEKAFSKGIAEIRRRQAIDRGRGTK